MAAPRPYLVTVTVTPNARNHLTKTETWRVGACNSIPEARTMIAEDRREMNDTLGGLIDAPGSSDRSYEVWKAVWTKVKI